MVFGLATLIHDTETEDHADCLSFQSANIKIYCSDPLTIVDYESFAAVSTETVGPNY